MTLGEALSSGDMTDWARSITCCHIASFCIALSIFLISVSIATSTWLLYSELDRLNDRIIPASENITTVASNILDGLAIAFPNNGWTTRSFTTMVNTVWPKTAAESTEFADTIAVGFRAAAVLMHQLSTSEIGPAIRAATPLLAEVRPADVRALMLFATNEIQNGNAHQVLNALTDTAPGSLRYLLRETAGLNLTTNAARVSAFLESPPVAHLLAQIDKASAYVELGPALRDVLERASNSSLIEHASASLAIGNRLVGHGIY
jgi:hypothetical protein